MSHQQFYETVQRAEEYYGDKLKALENILEFLEWQKQGFEKEIETTQLNINQVKEKLCR
jgi:hypothetical protein